MNRVLSLACLGVVLTAGGSAAAAPRPTVAVLGLELKDGGSGIDERSAKIAGHVTEALRSRPKTQSGPYTLAAGSEKEMVDAVLLAACGSPDKDCMVQIGADMAADFLIYGRMEKQRSGYEVALTLLDVMKKDRVRQVKKTLPSDQTTAGDIERWGRRLYGELVGDIAKGTLIVIANVETGAVYIDDERRGSLVRNEARIGGLDEGKRRLRIESAGWDDLETMVSVDGGETVERSVELKQNIIVGPGPRGRPGGMWRKTAVASGLVGLGAGAAWLYSYTQIRASERALCSGHAKRPGCVKSTTDPVEMDEIRASGQHHRNLTFYVEGPLTIAASGLFVYSVIKGFIRPGKRRTESSGLSIEPVVGPDGAIATLRFDW